MIGRYLDAEEEQYFVHLFIYLFVYLITFTTTEKQAVVGVAQQSEAPNYSAPLYPPNHDIAQKTDHNTGNYMPYPLRQVCGFFYVPQDYDY